MSSCSSEYDFEGFAGGVFKVQTSNFFHFDDAMGLGYLEMKSWDYEYTEL